MPFRKSNFLFYIFYRIVKKFFTETIGTLDYIIHTMAMETKKRLERIQKSLMQMDIPARPADLAKMLDVAPSSLSRWLGGEEAKGKQKEKIDLLYRTVLEATAENPTAKRMIAQFSRPVAGVGILATGLIGAVAAAGLG